MFRTTLRTGLAVAALMIAPIAASAADLPRQSYKSPVYSAPVYANWTGFYVGINGGYGFGNSNWDFPVGTNLRPKGAVVGGTIGFNYQTGVWVWGLEGDIDYSSIKGDATCGAATCSISNTWLGTARARLGYAGFGNWLPYITGGVAGGNLKASNSATGLEATKTKFGYAFGGGVEYAFMSNWSVKAEYLYASLGTFDCGAACGAATNEVSFKSSVVRAGLNYRF